MNAVFEKNVWSTPDIKNTIEKKISGVLQIMYLKLTFSLGKGGWPAQYQDTRPP